MRSLVQFSSFSVAKDRPDRHNEDFLECYPTGDTNDSGWADFAAVVADGVGSSDGPVDAARVAAGSWLLYTQAKFTENAAKCAGFDDIHFNEITTHAFSQAHEAVQKQTQGSACAASVCLQGDRLLVGNVGDCRVYRVRGAHFEQLSEDQVDGGGDPTQVVGGKRAPQAYAAAETRVRAGDVIILCTDGVWKLLEPSEILMAAAGANAKEIADKLQRSIMVRRRATSDDATAVVAVVKQVGAPFWGTDSELGDEELREDVLETKLNEVLAELLNRVRVPLEKQNARAEQSLNQLGLAVDELRSEIEVLKGEASGVRRGRKPSGGVMSSFAGVGIGLLILVGGFFMGWTLKGPLPATGKDVKPQLPANARVISQDYQNDRLLIKFKGGDDKARLAVFRLEDGGKPFAVIDLPVEKKNDVPVP
jgi:serine/threonine protein phosphatase PrpC